jgi:DNA-binding IclR family transcriptional regulator
VAEGSQTLERGLRVLRVLGDHPDGLSVTELATALGTNRAGVYRLLGPLLDARLVIRDAGGRHALGAGLIELASRVRPRLQEAAAAELRPLADQLRATTALTVRDGDEAVVTAVAEPRSTDMHIAYRLGLRHPLTRGAAGLAILAANEATAGERPEVAEARTRGWAATTGEILPGAHGIAAAVGSGASISAVWVGTREDESHVAEAVRAAAVRIMDAASA